MRAESGTDEGCEDMDCSKYIGTKVVEDESQCLHIADKSPSEIIEHKERIFSSESEEKMGHLSESSDVNGDRADDQDIRSSSLNYSEAEGSSPVQCTEDNLQIGIEEDCSRADLGSYPQSQVEVTADDTDLPSHTSECEQSDSNGSNNKAPRLVCARKICTGMEKPVVTEELGLKYRAEKDDSGKAAMSDQLEHTKSSPLDISPYLKFQPNQRQIICVNMIYEASAQVDGSTQIKLFDCMKSNPDPQCSGIIRLASFVSYPSDMKVFAITLADNGFIFLPDVQAVECYFCKLRINLVELKEPGADPKKLHKNRSPLCPMKGENCGKEPVEMPRTVSDKPDQGGSSGMTQELKTVGGSTGGCGERSAESGYFGDEALVAPSPVVQRPPDSVPHQIQEPFQSRSSADSNADVHRLRHTVQPVALAIDSVPRVVDTLVTDSVPMMQHPEVATVPSPVSTNRPETVGSRNKNTVSSSSPTETGISQSGSEQNGASASAASASTAAIPPKASKSKKLKGGKKPEAAASRKTPANSGGAGPASSSASAPNSVGNRSNGSSSSDKGEQGKEKKKLTYADLGIFAEKPKRPDMATLPKRLATFEGRWKATYAKTKEELGECGMYYAGYADCARCFFCGGGLKNWEAQDEPWVEHARWFPKCAYLLLCKGPMFVDIVQRKNKNNEKIIMKNIEEEVRQKTKRTEAASATSLPPSTSNAKQGSEIQVSSLRDLEAENEDLTSQLTCKICMDEKSCMVFLPCGHMVACTECAVVLKTCPLCRSDIRGTVKAHMDF